MVCVNLIYLKISFPTRLKGLEAMVLHICPSHTQHSNLDEFSFLHTERSSGAMRSRKIDFFSKFHKAESNKLEI